MGVKRIRKFETEPTQPSAPASSNHDGNDKPQKSLGITWKTERRKISDLVGFQGNPRQMSPKQVEDLTASLQRFNLAEIPAINIDNTILAGHQRLKVMAAIGRGNEVIDVRVPSRKLTASGAREYLVRSNRNTGSWDWDALANFDANDLEAWGFDPKELQENLEENGEHGGGSGSEQAIADDKAAQLQKKWKTQSGQLWVAGDHRILCADSTDPKAWARLMGNQKACLCNTDPPYGVSYQGITKKWQMIEGDKKRGDDLMSNLLIPAFRLMLQHTETDAAYYIWHGSSTRRDFEKALDTVGLEEKQYILWVKDAFALGHADYHHQVEPALYCQRSGQACRWTGDRCQSTVWRIQPCKPNDMAISVANGLRISDGQGNQLAVVPEPPKSKKTRLIRMDAGDTLSVMTTASTTAWQIARTDMANRLHPNQKPTALFRIPIANHTAPGDLIVEPFGGSGGQFVAAQETGRRCWGLEIDPKYLAVILERLTTECGLEPRQEKS